MRYPTLLLLLLGGCSSLSSDDSAQLARLQENAKAHYEGGNFGKALTLIERGTELDPDNYQLTALHGAILLRTSGSTLGTDHRQLDKATQVFERLFETRTPERHDRMLLLPYALVLQRQGRRYFAESQRLSHQPADAEAREQAAALRARSDSNFDRADELFKILIDQGNTPRLCYYHLLLAAYDRGRTEEFEEYAKEYLPLVVESQAAHGAEIKRTNTPGYEDVLKRQLAELRDEELEVRSLLAGHYYTQKNHLAALEMLNRVLDLDPKRSVDYYNRGRVLLRLDRDDAAKADFRKFLATTELPATSEKAVFAAQALTN